MPNHDDFEIAIEQRRHGALATEASARLDEHLAACEACRAIASAPTHLEDAMRDRAAAVAARVDWTGVERVIASWRHKATTRHAYGLLACAAVALGGWLVLHDASIVLVVVATAMIALEPMRRHDRNALEQAKLAQSSPGALLGFFRKELDHQIRIARRSWIGFAAGIGMALIPLQRPHAIWMLCVSIALILVFVGLTAWQVFVHIPRLRSERAALG